MFIYLYITLQGHSSDPAVFHKSLRIEKLLYRDRAWGLTVLCVPLLYPSFAFWYARAWCMNASSRVTVWVSCWPS